MKKLSLETWADLSKEALTLQPPPKNISSHTEQKSRAKRKRNYSLHCSNRHKMEWRAWTEHTVISPLSLYLKHGVAVVNVVS